MERWWDVEDLEELVYRLLTARLDERVRPWHDVIAYFSAVLFNHQRPSRAFAVGERHYDLGNDLYEQMLDSAHDLQLRLLGKRPHTRRGTTREARSGFSETCPATRTAGARRGLRLGRRPRMCGAGVRRRGRSITISREQAAFARSRCAGLPIEIRLQDYRDMRGDFDHISSIGMFEHVGPKNYRRYLDIMRRCLRPSGRFLLHTIGANGESKRRGNDPWIEKYIFPNSKLPIQPQIDAALRGVFRVAGRQAIGTHYIPTLRAWRADFERHWSTLRKTRDDAFYRMWEFYLNSSAATFRAAKNDVWQFLLTPE